MHRLTGRRPLSLRRAFLVSLGAPLLAAPACRPQAAPREILVTGVDYAFQLPDTLSPGRTILRFHNAGAVPHEMGLALLKQGITLARVLEVVKAGGSPDSLTDGAVGILIARPGATTLGALATDLLPGRTYALFCNFRDAPDKPPHSMLGMVSSREVPPAK
jgi:hypothetical protein